MSEKKRKQKKRKNENPDSHDKIQIMEHPDDDVTPSEIVKEDNSPQDQSSSYSRDFSAFYLKKVTQEFEDDLDKIRTAGDFRDSSLQILVHALKQGETLFSETEKSRVISTMP